MIWCNSLFPQSLFTLHFIIHAFYSGCIHQFVCPVMEKSPLVAKTGLCSTGIAWVLWKSQCGLAFSDVNVCVFVSEPLVFFYQVIFIFSWSLSMLLLDSVSVWSVGAVQYMYSLWCWRTCHCRMNCDLRVCSRWQWTTCWITSWMLEGRASGRIGSTSCGTEHVASERFIKTFVSICC